mgnify:CR=1 FL=1
MEVIIYAKNRVLHRSSWETYKYWLMNIAIFVICVIVCNRILPSHYDSYIELFVVGAVSSVLILGIVIGTIFIFTYKKSKPMLASVIQRIRHRK